MSDKPYCDLIMKGGITSGIVYPRLAARLARDYRIKNIGGTSAGAIAAAACAAAELGRSSGSNPAAFEQLQELPNELGAEAHGATRLLSLFQPAPPLRRHFALVLACLGQTSGGERIVSVLQAAFPHWLFLIMLAPLLLAMQLLAGRDGHAAASATLAMLLAPLAAWAAAAGLPLLLRLLRCAPATPSGLLGARLFLAALALMLAAASPPAARPLLLAVASLFLAVVAAGASSACGAWRLFSSLLRGLHGNFYGICNGLTSQGGNDPRSGLTDWLDAYLKQLAGLQDPTRPLVFGDLWHAAGKWQDEQPDASQRRINLEVVTTALSQHKPYALPFRDGSGAFYYDPAEWRRLFPAYVVDYLDRVAVAPENGQPLLSPSGAVLHRLQPGAKLPVIVAVRMSLSFPLLLSGVPLYALDFTEKQGRAPAPVKRVWFSDGGISSNLPLHFFDELLPDHPTFAINLNDEHPLHPIDDSQPPAKRGRVFLPATNRQGILRPWQAPEDSTPAGLFAFLGNIFATMQRWRDESLFPYPGYRNRIAHVTLKANEGGLNLNMPAPLIAVVSQSGETAGDMLYKKFHPHGGGQGWREHQRQRLLTVLGNLERTALHAAATQPRWQAAIYSYQSIRRQKLATDLLQHLADMGATVERAGATRVDDIMPRPRPILRMAPRL
ncbi:Patatin-like phospholipase [Duganella sp. CF402]|uniref:patatin-like phospholipase family protein n=1 Tax=unclassified Duganella TaxID=2636909 RepID=UPI0008CE05D8|nr:MULTISPECIES: patatin-like phospholipase family protein [unclassified Duganella]RZT06245.1 patatin-like phospholipase [Duganella sp. BK701]SEM70779.1 Patatin-like phospholipase [Duganella sp. CF402]